MTRQTAILARETANPGRLLLRSVVIEGSEQCRKVDWRVLFKNVFPRISTIVADNFAAKLHDRLIKSGPERRYVLKSLPRILFKQLADHAGYRQRHVR